MAFVEEGVPQGLKPSLYFAAFSARLKSCPVTKRLRLSFFAAFEVVPFQSIRLIRSFWTNFYAAKPRLPVLQAPPKVRLP
jgi:hypothetical protein